jgi:hypothetical protein
MLSKFKRSKVRFMLLGRGYKYVKDLRERI